MCACSMHVSKTYNSKAEFGFVRIFSKNPSFSTHVLESPTYDSLFTLVEKKKLHKL